MSEWAGMTPTGRRVAGPAADLVELEAPGEDTPKSTAIVFHERYRKHELLTTGVELIRSFLEFPMVTGLVEMSHWLPDEGAFIFPTGTSWTATEVMRTYRDVGQTVGVRAVVELMYLAGAILHEAAETGPQEGVFSHGSLSPLRVLVKADGQVQIIGHGLPQVEIAAWRADPSDAPPEDAFRYCPPERIAGQAEDGDSDVFCLALVAWELLTNEPVYSGSAKAIVDQATKGAAADVVRRGGKGAKVPKDVIDVLVQALDSNPAARGTTADFLTAVEDLLGTTDGKGPSLSEIMDKVRGSARRGVALAGGRDAGRSRGVPVKGGPPVPAGRGAAGPVGGIALHRFAGPAAARPGAQPAAPPAADADSRWGKPVRRGDEGEEAAPGGKVDRSALRDRLRRAKEGGEAEAAAPVAESGGSARDRLRDRLRKTKEDEATAEAADSSADASAGAARAPREEPKAEAADDAKQRLRDRLRRSSSDESGRSTSEAADEKPAEAAEAAPAAEPEPAAKPAGRGRPDRGFTEEEEADEKPTRLPRSSTPKAEPAKAEPAKAEPAAEEPAKDDRAALRDRLRSRRAAAEEPAKAADPEPEPEPPKDEDPREALRRKLKERRK